MTPAQRARQVCEQLYDEPGDEYLEMKYVERPSRDVVRVVAAAIRAAIKEDRKERR